ncbi:MAG: ATP-binding cassette domain-containing protein [Paraglaciecola sp.]|uniref:ATP-binding cassette domain-containing protein n=1 Tax=Paraglaciecola sp. TaxID=1920173 RepID=UPI00329A2FBC
MKQLTINHISFLHTNGDKQFCNINFNLPQGLTGLVGDNGVGKSLLVDIITAKVKATTGTVELIGPLIFLEQNPRVTLTNNKTVADYLGAASKLNALKNIENGSIAEQDYQLVADDWLFASTFKRQLAKLSKNISPNSKLCHLSGGELNKLMLYRLFNQAALENAILILDEPSNHLDGLSKQWLAEQLLSFKGQCLLISHDRLLLNLCRHIAKLTPLGIELVESNYDGFEQQRLLNENAQAKKLKQLLALQKRTKLSAQRDAEKAQKRASQGVKKSKQGGLPKILLGSKQHQSEASLSAKMSQHQSKLSNIAQQLLAAKTPNVATPIQFGLTANQQKTKRLLQVKDILLPHVNTTVSMEVKNGEKWHLNGKNGSGKSSFLHLLTKLSHVQKPSVILANDNAINTPQIYTSAVINTQICLLDQHCSLIQNHLSLLENFSHFCPQLNQSDRRTLLATNGFRKDKVFQKAASLSPGEKMRLAMLIASHQHNTLLLLDEPDNHLDISSKEILSDALLRFNSSFILVSHDQEFVDKCGITHKYELT